MDHAAVAPDYSAKHDIDGVGTAADDRAARDRNDIEPVHHETLHRIITGIITVAPFLALGAVAVQLWQSLLRSHDLDRVRRALCRHRAGRHGGLPPALHAPQLQDRSPAARRSRDPGLGGDRGPGHLLGRRPPQAPRLLRPARATRTARTSTMAPAGAARCAGWCTRTSGWLFIHTQRGARDALRPRPASPTRSSAGSTGPSWCGRWAGWARPSGSAG